MTAAKGHIADDEEGRFVMGLNIELEKGLDDIGFYSGTYSYTFKSENSLFKTDAAHRILYAIELSSIIPGGKEKENKFKTILCDAIRRHKEGIKYDIITINNLNDDIFYGSEKIRCVYFRYIPPSSIDYHLFTL